MKKRVCHCLGHSHRRREAALLGHVSSIRHPGEVYYYGWPAKMSNTALTGPSRSSRKLLKLSTVQIAGILLLNNCYVGAIMQCLFNNPKMTIFDQLTAGQGGRTSSRAPSFCMTQRSRSAAFLHGRRLGYAFNAS